MNGSFVIVVVVRGGVVAFSFVASVCFLDAGIVRGIVSAICGDVDIVRGYVDVIRCSASVYFCEVDMFRGGVDWLRGGVSVVRGGVSVRNFEKMKVLVKI